jgi:hypothetical protein
MPNQGLLNEHRRNTHICLQILKQFFHSVLKLHDHVKRRDSSVAAPLQIAASRHQHPHLHQRTRLHTENASVAKIQNKTEAIKPNVKFVNAINNAAVKRKQTPILFILHTRNSVYMPSFRNVLSLFCNTPQLHVLENR